VAATEEEVITSRRGIPGRAIQVLATSSRSGDWPVAIDLAIRSETPIRRPAAGP
jgi:hypothetical protein